MTETPVEYTVRDYSAVDAQVAQIAERERILTNKLKLANLKQALLLAAAALLAFGIFLLLAGGAYRIAFPSKPEIIEKVEIIEKIIEPQKIIINTPLGSNAIQSDSSQASPIWGGANNTSATKDASNTAALDSATESSTSTPTSSTIETPKEKKSEIGLRSVTTFTNVPSNVSGYNSVVTGWRWLNKDATQPSEQYCYVEKIAGLHATSINIARIKNGVGKPTSSYSAEAAEQAGMSKQRWDFLVEKCRWWKSR